MNKFELMNTVTMSDLAPADKVLLIELLLRSDENGYSWPSVQRLCMARGIKHEKNFKGADRYLPGFVTKTKSGRKNTYTLNIEAIKALKPAEVSLKHTAPQDRLTDTPDDAGINAPSLAADTPAIAAISPDGQGANSTKNTTKNNTSNSSKTSDACASSVDSIIDELEMLEVSFSDSTSLNPSSLAPSLTSSTKGASSATAGASAQAKAECSPPAAMAQEEW